MSNNKYHFNDGDGVKIFNHDQGQDVFRLLQQRGYKTNYSVTVGFPAFIEQTEGVFEYSIKCDNEIPFDYMMYLIGNPFGKPCFDDVNKSQFIANEETEIPFIFIENERILLKVDAQGFVTIEENVVGHEPGLPRLIEMWKEQAKKGFSDSDFNPDEAFEVSLDGIEWNKCEDAEYTGLHHGIVMYGNHSYWTSIRNVKKPELVEGQPVWFKQFEDRAIWEFGFYLKGGNVSIQGSGISFNPQTIRPFFVGGIATYPPFND